MRQKPKYKILNTKYLLVALLGVFVLSLVPVPAKAVNDFKPSQIKFDITTDNTTFRAVKGEKLTIKTKFSLASDSVRVTVNNGSEDTDSINSNRIDGFYVAYVGKGVGQTCGNTGCYFEAETAHVTSLPSGDLNLDIKTDIAGDKEIWIFPVAELRVSVDAPFTTNPLTVKVEVYNSTSELASKARADGPAQTNKTSAIDAGDVVRYEKVKFNIETDGTSYNTYVGGRKITVDTKISFTDDSVKLKVGDKMYNPSLLGVNHTVQGFYVATAGKGATKICDTISCNFEEEAPTPHAQTIPINHKLVLDTNDTQKYPVGTDREIWIFPVIDQSSVDAPYTDSPATIKIHIYESKTVFDNAAAAVGISPDSFYVIGGSRSSQTTATGGNSSDPILGTIIKVVNIILGFIIAIVRWIIWILGIYIFVPLLETTLAMDASDITGVIVTGWTFVRDVSNMFFILALIIIGFATMLRLESYNYKKLLVWLIAMALLVNFSLVIGRIIIQIADTAQHTFLPSGDLPGQPAGMTGVKFLFENMTTSLGSTISGNFQGFSFSASHELAITGTMIFQLILDLAVVLTFGALAVFMLIRTTALWILLILSPVAYVLNIIPATEHYAKEWWTNFLKYAFFAPIAAFFMRLSLELYQNGMRIIPESSTLYGTAGANQNLSSYLTSLSKSGGKLDTNTFLQLLMIYFIVIAFLWAGLLITKKMGVYGADAVVGLAEKGLKAPFAGGKWLAGRGVGFAGMKWNEWTSKLVGESSGAGKKALFAVLNPVGFFKGWGHRAEERREQARELATGAGQEVVSGMWTLGKEKLPYKELARRRIENQMVKKLREAMGEDVDKAEAKDLVERVKDVGGFEGELLRGAASKIYKHDGYGDDANEMIIDESADEYKLPHIPQVRERYNDVSSQYTDWAFVGLDVEVLNKLRNDITYKSSPEFKNWLRKDGNQSKLRTLYETTKASFDVGHYEQGYQAVKDSEGQMYGKEFLGYYVPVVDEVNDNGELLPGGKLNRTEAIQGEVMKVAIRTYWQKGAWHNFKPKVKVVDPATGKESWQVGDFVDEETGESLLTEYNKRHIKDIGAEKIDQLTHAQARQIINLIGKYVDEYGNITNPIQYQALRELNPTFAEALKNVRVYGRPHPTPDDEKKLKERLNSVRIQAIIKDNDLDDRHRPAIEKVFKEYTDGTIDVTRATSELATAGIAPSAVSSIIGEVKTILATTQGGTVVATGYIPPTAYKKLQSARLVKKYNEAVKKGVQEGFLIGPQFNTPANKAALAFRIESQISPILSGSAVGLSSAEVRSIAAAMADKIDKK